jgi:peptidoglycan/LPS O-acetylase OafA/YrhL
MTSKTGDAYAYKPFVDGLRAVAISTVVAAHVGIPGFAGGFVGVDIFFVISGYLIINLILADIHSGRYGFLAFEARRALRILPPFLLVMVVTLILGTTIFVLPDYKRFAEVFFFATVLQSNHEFLSHQGYFEMAAFTQPLLHTWSLAVEEQFYLVTPLVLFGLVTWTLDKPEAKARRVWIAVSVGLAVAIFAACVVFTRSERNFSFYLMPTRGWEFILGGIAPYIATTVRRWPRWTIELLCISGLVAIAYAVNQFNANTIFPSYRVGLPALGATLIIVGGLAAPRSRVTRVLAVRPMVMIGLVSYSWYLWHWPLLSFLRTTNFGKRDLRLDVASAIAALLLATITYRLVEVPIRQWRAKAALRPAPVVLGGFIACLVVASGGFGWAAYVAPNFLPDVTEPSPLPAVADDAAPPITHNGILLGDSHAGAIFAPLKQHARKHGVALKFVGHSGCPPYSRFRFSIIPGCDRQPVTTHIEAKI